MATFAQAISKTKTTAPSKIASSSASSSEEPFDDYLVQGIGKSPMVMIYESRATEDGHLYVAMEYVDGKTLRTSKDAAMVPMELREKT